MHFYQHFEKYRCKINECPIDMFPFDSIQMINKKSSQTHFRIGVVFLRRIREINFSLHLTMRKGNISISLYSNVLFFSVNISCIILMNG